MKNVILGAILVFVLSSCALEEEIDCDAECHRACANSCTGDNICLRHCKDQ
jgi:hypothetical protein